MEESSKKVCDIISDPKWSGGEGGEKGEPNDPELIDFRRRRFKARELPPDQMRKGAGCPMAEPLEMEEHFMSNQKT